MLLVAAYLLFSITGVTLVKLGGNHPTIFLNLFNLQIQFSWLSIAGILCYGISFLLFITILPRYDLSYITPLTIGITQILLLGIAFIIFHENITITRVLGILTIVAGIYILNIK
jgi:multidrug transporter EmrE-like cation transporter